MTKVGRNAGVGPPPREHPAVGRKGSGINLLDVKEAQTRYVVGRPPVPGKNVIEHAFNTSPIGRREMSPEGREAMEHAMRVLFAATDLARKTFDPGGSDPGSGVS